MILVIISLLVVFDNPGYSSFKDRNVAVSTQEFQSEKACLFARDAILRRAGDHRSKLDAFCVAKGDAQ